MPPLVSLVEVSRDNVDAVIALDVHPAQRALVASNAKSIAQAHFWPDETWFRAISADGELVGFLMMVYEGDAPPCVARLMVDQRFQGRGIGREAVRLAVEAARARRPEATELRLSHGPEDGHAGPFYEKLGFAYTGEVSDGERVMALPLRVS